MRQESVLGFAGQGLYLGGPQLPRKRALVLFAQRVDSSLKGEPRALVVKGIFELKPL